MEIKVNNMKQGDYFLTQTVDQLQRFCKATNSELEIDSKIVLKLNKGL